MSKRLAPEPDNEISNAIEGRSVRQRTSISGIKPEEDHEQPAVVTRLNSIRNSTQNALGDLDVLLRQIKDSEKHARDYERIIAENAKLKSDLSKLQDDNSTVTSENRRLMEENENQREEIEETFGLRKENKTLTFRLATAEKELKSVSAQSISKQNELETRISALEAKLKAETLANQQQTIRVQELLADKSDKLAEAREVIDTAIDELRKQRKEMDVEHAALPGRLEIPSLPSSSSSSEAVRGPVPRRPTIGRSRRLAHTKFRYHLRLAMGRNSDSD